MFFLGCHYDTEISQISVCCLLNLKVLITFKKNHLMLVIYHTLSEISPI